MKVIHQTLIILLLMVILFLSNCTSLPPHSPIQEGKVLGINTSMTFGTYTYPAPGFNLSQLDNLGSKVGSSCITRYSQGYLAYFLSEVKGDMSVPTAAKAGGITKVKLVSYQVRRQPSNYFSFIFLSDTVQICTIVHGD